MRRNDHILDTLQRIVRGHRLLLKDIQPGSRNYLIPKGFIKSGFIHDGAAARVDQDGIRFHLGQAFGIDQVVGRFVQHRVKADTAIPCRVAAATSTLL